MFLIGLLQIGDALHAAAATLGGETLGQISTAGSGVAFG
jgi:hypothetical protein